MSVKINEKFLIFDSENNNLYLRPTNPQDVISTRENLTKKM